MSLNEMPSGVRTHIVFYGCTNVGKSSLVNKFTNQDLSIVSSKEGTTTDPVRKAMEILPLGPVVVIDTPGLDDTTALGELRIQRTQNMLLKTDIAILVVDAAKGITATDEELIEKFKTLEIAYLIVYNKGDQAVNKDSDKIYTNALTGEGVNELREKVGHLLPESADKPLVRDLVNKGDMLVLVVPIDSSAPKGRLILPQQQVIRDALEVGAVPVVCQVDELASTLARLGDNVKLVVTDSQAFREVAAIVPERTPLTSFSILMARAKGNLIPSVKGARVISTITDEDVILISEGCTHHRQCEDIGTVKLPNLIRKFTGKNPVFEFTSGGEYPQNLTKYKLIIHCGACTLTEREASGRYKLAASQGVAITNYGIAIACMNGILERSIKILDERKD